MKINIYRNKKFLNKSFLYQSKNIIMRIRSVGLKIGL